MYVPKGEEWNGRTEGGREGGKGQREGGREGVNYNREGGIKS